MKGWEGDRRDGLNCWDRRVVLFSAGKYGSRGRESVNEQRKKGWERGENVKILAGKQIQGNRSGNRMDYKTDI